MCIIHFLKREYETICVHRFGNDTMPFSNVFKNSFHYWILCGFLTMFFVLHPKYETPIWQTQEMKLGLMGIWALF